MGLGSSGTINPGGPKVTLVLCIGIKNLIENGRYQKMASAKFQRHRFKIDREIAGNHAIEPSDQFCGELSFFIFIFVISSCYC